jgi:hypothetical protein
MADGPSKKVPDSLRARRAGEGLVAVAGFSLRRQAPRVRRRVGLQHLHDAPYSGEQNLDPRGIIRKHESLLGRPQTEDFSRRRQTRRLQARDRQPVRGEPLLGQTLHQDGARGRLAGPEEKPPGRPPKGTDATRRLLEADLAERPAASAAERRRYLERMTGESMSDSTVRRLVKRLGHSREKDRPSPPSARSS